MPIKEKAKPSTLLGFLLGGVIVIFIGFCIWQMNIDNPKANYLLGPQQWVVAFAAITAMCGWIIASIVTIRNSVKQHTITTLLQSRLSATYMCYADKISEHYMKYDEDRAGNLPVPTRPTDGVDELALRYILNYFEFIAIGITRGDLDEPMLKDSFRGIVRKNVEMSRLWMEGHRKGNPSLYEHLIWLHHRWVPEDPPVK